MSETYAKSLQSKMKLVTSWGVSGIVAGSRLRHTQKALSNLRTTILCGFVTILVLRGSIGTGTFGFGSPGQDDDKVKENLSGVQRTMMEFEAVADGAGNQIDKKVTDGDSATTGEDSESDFTNYFDPNSTEYRLGEAVTDWDQQRAAIVSQNGFGNRISRGNPRILLVSGSQPKPCDNANGDYLVLKNLKNKMDYCRLHGIEIFFNTAHLDSQMSGFWAKLPLIRKLMLAHPNVEWIWWMDSDAFFTDMQFELPMEKYQDYNMVLHGWDHMIYEKKSWIGLNTGSFLLRNCQWSLDLLDSWAPYGPIGNRRTVGGKLMTKYLTGRPDFEADDQSALIYLLITQKEKWSTKTFLESSYFLHGYWVILVENFEKMMEKYHPGLGDERWPFVTHFVGCKPCHGSSGDYTAERCTKQMERAFNFADNQILQAYGYHHPDLETHQVIESKYHADTMPRFLRGNGV